MKELIKPNQIENSYEDESVKGLCPELRYSCTPGFSCGRGYSADMDDDEILF